MVLTIKDVLGRGAPRQTCWPRCAVTGSRKRVAMILGLRHRISVLLIALVFAPALWGDSYIRSARLSWVEGDVQTQRAGEDVQPALLNMPVVEGMTLSTGND